MINKHIPRKLGITATIALLLITSTILVGQTIKPANATQPINVYLGYADSLRSGASNFPTPWVGSTNMGFQGVTTGPWDNGAIRIDNPTLSPVNIDSVVVDLPGSGCGPAGCRPAHFDLWTHGLVIPPHTGMIFSCTGSCASAANSALDTSDFQVEPCGTNAPAGFADPIVTISIGGVPQTYDDSGHVLDTRGFDLACLQNESTPWTLVGSIPIAYSEQLFVGGLPLSGPVLTGTAVTEVASSTDITIDNFVFHWKDPSNTEVRTQTSTTNTDLFAPTTPGNWNVCVDFLSGTTLKNTICSPFQVSPPPLVITAPPNISVNTDPNLCSSSPSLGTATVTGGVPSYTITSSPSAPFPKGTTTVTWTVTDSDSPAGTATATQTVTVIDNQPPTITSPPNITVPANSISGATGVNLGVPTTSDNCPGVTFTNNAPSTFPIGVTTVIWTATDANGNTAQSTQTVTVTTITQGFMTGGGSIIDPTAGRVTHGFELQCDVTKGPNNLEVNWGNGHKFHLDSLATAVCVNDPTISPNPPKTSFDTYFGSGTGSLNGVSGATATWTLTDAGEPGTNDHASIVIKDSSGNTILTVSGNLQHGNQQAHNQ